MTCSCSSLTDATARHFDEQRIRQELASYRSAGPAITTQGLLNGLLGVEPRPKTMLEIGSGIGALTFGMLKAGVQHAVCVDMSPAALAVSAEEAQRQEVQDRIEWLQGDFVALAPAVPSADLVALDRVVCCYPAYAPLLEQAAAHSRRLLAMSFPKCRWWVRVALWMENLWRQLRGDPFRAFVHPPGAMSDLLQRHGFKRTWTAATWTWQIEIYARRAD
jgi:magnesium-protoporphyrin O-methyltransferase